jgi:nitrate reductase beta subunit
MASCPSGAIYKRAEDGIVLVDQDRCRGWRQCVTGCPYKKIYFNHKTGKAEKCTLCYPRIEVGLPTVCSETCVGRLRYLGLFLYDADRVTAAAATPNEKDLYAAQLDLILDPNDPQVVAAARQQGIPEDWLAAARRSPVYALAKTYKVALPPHPEYRTMPMVWYIPPLSPSSTYFVIKATMPSPRVCFSEPSARCAFRWSIWPSCLPQVMSVRSSAC